MNFAENSGATLRLSPRGYKRCVLGAAIFALSSAAALAQGIEGTPEEQAACTPDALKLCQTEIPDAERVKVCLVEHVSELTPACREVFTHRKKVEDEAEKARKAR